MLEQMQSLGDCAVSWVELGSPCIGVDGISYLVIATLVEAAEIKPDFRNVGVDADCP